MIDIRGSARSVLDFWFDAVGKDRWFVKDAALDSEIASRFGALREGVIEGEAAGWRDTPDGLLAAIILIDQFGRNIHRGSARAFAGDPLARRLTNAALAAGWDEEMSQAQRQFLLMPLMHSEAMADQHRAIEEFGRLGDPDILKFARLHRDQIARFGRFPGRNAALGRQSTPEEIGAAATSAF